MATGSFVSFQGATGNGGADASYTHLQSTAREIWNVSHPLDKKPSVIIENENGEIVFGEIKYLSNVNIQITFSFAISGKAYLN